MFELDVVFAYLLNATDSSVVEFEFALSPCMRYFCFEGSPAPLLVACAYVALDNAADGGSAAVERDLYDGSCYWTNEAVCDDIVC